MSFHPADVSSVQHWRIDRAGRLEECAGVDDASQGVAFGTVTPGAASGWIELPRGDATTLEAGVRGAITLTQILDKLGTRYPGHRWFVRAPGRKVA